MQAHDGADMHTQADVPVLAVANVQGQADVPVLAETDVHALAGGFIP